MKKSKGISINKKNNFLLKFVIIVAGILLLIFCLNFFNTKIKSTFYSFSSPLNRAFWSAGESASSYLGSVLTSASLAKENQNLKNENQNLLSQVASLNSLISSNQAQNDISLASQNTNFKLTMAGVTGLDGKDLLSINKGSDNGILLGMPVINQQNILFGKVFKVYKNFSQVMLISNKDSVINVKVQQIGLDTTKQIDGVIKGSGNLGVYLDLISIDDTINQGDTLVTSSLDGFFPKDILVGKITKVQKNDQNPHQQAQIQPFFNIRADNVFVITNYKQAN